MQLVDEEHAARLQRRQERRDVPLALQRRAGGLDERDVELGGEDLRQRRLPQPGRAGQQDVVECLAACSRRLQRHRELLLELLLADEVAEALWSQRAVEVLLEGGVGGLDARHERAARSAPLSSSSAVSPSVAASNDSASAGV